MNTTEDTKKKGRPRGERVVKTCPNCDRQFEVIPADITKCCSMACRDEWRAKNPKPKKVSTWATCLACDKQFATYQSTLNAGYGKFCSWDCRVPYMKANRMTAPTNSHAGSFDCIECGTTVKINSFAAKRRKYCSILCRDNAVNRQGSPRKLSRLKLKCAWCKKEFERLGCHVGKRGRKRHFCSRVCNGSFSARRSQRSVSKVETEFFRKLSEAGMNIRTQVRIGRYTVDAVRVGHNVAIEFDGEYWHSLPRVQAKDERKSIAIAWAGYKLIRVSERSFYDDPEATIASVIQQANTI